MNHVATVTEINLFPVKSMQGISVEQADLWWYGLEGDRKRAFVQSDNRSAFPWLTGREYPDLVRYEAYFSDPTNPATSPIGVKTLSGLDLDLDDPALLEELSKESGRSIHLMKLGRGVFDAMPISILSKTFVQSIADGLGEPVDTRRFRANIVVDVEQPSHGFPEEEWLNSTLTFGDENTGAQVQTNYRIQRCAMVNIDPDNSQRNPAVLKTVGQFWNACAGIYGATKQLGTIRVGDGLFIGDPQSGS